MAAVSKPRLTLYRGFLDKGQYVWSPFVVKAEARLRFAGLPYQTAVGGVHQAPKGKIPYLELGDGTVLPDSTLMIAELTSRGMLPDLNARLGPEQRNHDLALRALLEEKLYFYCSWEKWIQNFHVQRDKALWAVPWPLRLLVGQVVYRRVAATLHGQGTGRLTPEEIAAGRAQIWGSIAELLQASRSKGDVGGDGGVFWALGGDAPTEVDATLFGFLVSAIMSTSGPDSRKLVQSHPILLEYAGRIHDKYFPDYEKWTE